MTIHYQLVSVYARSGDDAMYLNGKLHLVYTPLHSGVVNKHALFRSHSQIATSTDDGLGQQWTNPTPDPLQW